MRRRRPREIEAVTLPRLVVVPDGDGFALSLDGQPVTTRPVPRAELGHTIARTIEAAGGPVRVDVRDGAGGVYSDIIEPPHGTDDRAPWVDQAAFAVHYRGFLPGEEVLVAVVDRSDTANTNGVVTLSITKELLGSRQLVLFGRASGTTFVAGSA
jgi:hypothetical protein